MKSCISGGKEQSTNNILVTGGDFPVSDGDFSFDNVCRVYVYRRAMEEDWQQFLTPIFLGLLFSYLLAYLISIVVSFKEDKLTIARASEPYQVINETESVTAEHGSVTNESLIERDQDIDDEEEEDDDDDDDDDWEGVESTELDETFSAATAFVAAAAADRLSHKVSTDLQLQLYALYKIATEGPCSAPPPSALKMTARAKWHAWQKLGAMPPEDAMQKYIDIVTELYPTWVSGSAKKRKDGRSDTQNTDAKGPMGPVFSTHVFEEEAGNELKMEAIHAFAREGDVKNLVKCIESGVSVNLKDSEGRAPLHWAVDRGHLNVVEVLVGSNCDVNAKDNEGQTALHYAAVCEREAIAEVLIKENADVNVKDNDGKSVNELCDVKWACLQHA